MQPFWPGVSFRYIIYIDAFNPLLNAFPLMSQEKGVEQILLLQFTPLTGWNLS